MIHWRFLKEIQPLFCLPLSSDLSGQLRPRLFLPSSRDWFCTLQANGLSISKGDRTRSRRTSHPTTGTCYERAVSRAEEQRWPRAIGDDSHSMTRFNKFSARLSVHRFVEFFSHLVFRKARRFVLFCNFHGFQQFVTFQLSDWSYKLVTLPLSSLCAFSFHFVSLTC